MINRTKTVELGERFEAALVYAARLHKHQKRKLTNVSYICHLLAVAALVIEAGGCEDTAIAALLHDAVEDQGGQSTLIEIEEQFGVRVASWVHACSAREMTEKESWRSHKQEYLKQIETSPPQVKQIILADKIHNGRALLQGAYQFGINMWDNFAGNQTDIVWIYKEYCRVFARQGHLSAQLASIAGQLEIISHN